MTLDSNSDRLGDLHAKVSSFLAELGCDNEAMGDVYRYYQGSTVVFMRPTMWLDKYTILQFTAVVLTDVPREGNEYMFEYFSNMNNELHFGRLSWESQEIEDVGNVILTHSLLGDYLDREELQTSLLVLAYTADEIDEELQARFGGKRWLDGIRDGQDDKR